MERGASRGASSAEIKVRSLSQQKARRVNQHTDLVSPSNKSSIVLEQMPENSSKLSMNDQVEITNPLEGVPTDIESLRHKEASEILNHSFYKEERTNS